MGTLLQVAITNKDAALKCSDQYEALKSALKSTYEVQK
jgi:hypothetical protein